MLITVLLLVGAGVAAAVFVAGGPGGSAQLRGAAAGRTQSTLLVQLRGPDGSAIGSALLGHDAKNARGSMLLVPDRVVADVPGHGPLPYGEALALPDPDLSRQSVADLVGVTVDTWWTMDGPALVRLVDRVGGVLVDVDTAVRAATPDGGATIVVPAGRAQRLNGSAAMSYATYLAAGEEQVAQLPRWQAVLQGVLRSLPLGAPAAGSTLQSLGTGLVTSAPVNVLAGVLTGAAADLRAGELAAETLPVRRIDTGTDQPAYGIDRSAVRDLVDRQLADSVPAGSRSGDNRVLVLNGVGRPGLGEQARARLQSAGLAYVGSRNASNFDYPRSKVLVFDDTPQAQVLGRRAAAALSLPPDTPVQYSPQAQSIADVIAILGQDFPP